MTRGVPKGTLTNSDLIKLLRLDANQSKELRRIDLVRLAHEAGLFESDVQREDTLPTTESTLKCYLYSVVDNKTVREKLESYVHMYSLLYTRGSIIANQLAIDTYGNIEVVESIPKYNAITTIATTNVFFDWLDKANSSAKQCFLPERWPSGKVDRDDRIQNVLENENILPALIKLLPAWRDLMTVSGWDNSINRMWVKYFTNLKNHCCVHLYKMTLAYFEKVQLSKESTRSVIIDIFKYGYRRPSISNPDDIDHALYIRNMLGCPYYKTDFEFTSQFMDFVIYMRKHGVGEATYFPLSKMGRKYAYVDLKIAKSLLGEPKQGNFMAMFNLTPESFKARRKELRKRLRKGANKKVAKKWWRTGLSTMKKKSKVCSFETDGVGMSICLKTAVPLYSPPTRFQDNEILESDNPVFIGGDEGRAKIMTCAVSTNPLKQPTKIVFSRRSYYRSTKHKARLLFETSEREKNHGELQNVIQQLSLSPKHTMTSQYVRRVADEHFDVMKREFIVNKERALWRMRLYRMKKRSLDRAAQRIFQAANKRPVVIGVGNAKFAPTGIGEMAVPTTGFNKALARAKYRYHKKSRIIGIDEFRTTMCCCACGEITTAPLVGGDRPSRRLRFCNNCNQQNGKGLRDRDIQAARNMLWCTINLFYGIERPSYLTRPPR